MPGSARWQARRIWIGGGATALLALALAAIASTVGLNTAAGIAVILALLLAIATLPVAIATLPVAIATLPVAITTLPVAITTLVAPYRRPDDQAARHTRDLAGNAWCAGNRLARLSSV